MKTSRAYREAILRRAEFEAHCVSVGGEMRVCAHCAKPFAVANVKSLRRYCNQRCNNGAYLNRKLVESEAVNG